MAALQAGSIWTEMSCDICGETWPLPCGPAGQAFALQVIEGARVHWIGHIRRGEDRRIPAEKWRVYASQGGTR
jgi:hypothetical protein